MRTMSKFKYRNICNDCKEKDKCTKCKLHIPKHPFKICNFCKFNQKPINEGNYMVLMALI